MLRGHLALSAGFLTAAVLVAGCEKKPSLDGPVDGASGPSSPASAAPTSARATPPPSTIDFSPRGAHTPSERAVLAAYRGWLGALTVAFTTGDVRGLDRTVTGSPHDLMVRRATGLHALAQTQQGPIRARPQIVDVRGGVARLIDCIDLRDFRTYDRTGTPIRPRDRGPTAVEATFTLIRGAWRMSAYTERTGGCAT